MAKLMNKPAGSRPQGRLRCACVAPSFARGSVPSWFRKTSTVRLWRFTPGSVGWGGVDNAVEGQLGDTHHVSTTRTGYIFGGKSDFRNDELDKVLNAYISFDFKTMVW